MRDRSGIDQLSFFSSYNDLKITSNNIHRPKYVGDVGFDLVCNEDVTIGPKPRTNIGSIQRWAYYHRFVGIVPMLLNRVLGDYYPNFVKVDHNLRMELPYNTWGYIMPRSSAIVRGLYVVSSPIDNGYRGPIFTLVVNESFEKVIIKKGDRISQLVMFNSVVPNMTVVSSVSESERGTNGFGSTG